MVNGGGFPVHPLSIAYPLMYSLTQFAETVGQFPSHEFVEEEKLGSWGFFLATTQGNPRENARDKRTCRGCGKVYIKSLESSTE